MVTWRAILLGVLFEVLIIFWIAYSEITARVFISSWCLVMPGIFLLLLVALYNRAMRRHPRAQLSQREQIIIYLMLAVSVLIPGYSFIQLLLPTVGTPFFYATPENEYARIQPYLPEWLFPRDPKVLYGLFAGYSRVPWKAWLVPMAAWGSLILAICLLFVCTSLLISKQWIRAEKLPFPITALPLEMTGDRPAFFRSSAMWIGFAIPAILETLLAFNYWFPTVPAVVLKHRDMSYLITARPWTGLYPIVIGWSPFVIGMAFVVPADISFSCWFFLIFIRMLRVWAVAMGWDAQEAGAGLNRFPYPVEQTVGAFLMLAVLALWRSRTDIRAAFAHAFVPQRLRGEGGAADLDRASRWAAVGWVGSAAFFITFLAVAGLNPFMGAGVLAVILLLCVTMARVRAEAGPPWVFGPFQDTASFWVQNIGAAHLHERTLSLLSAFRWLYQDIRFLTLPAQLEMLKLGELARINRRRTLIAMAVATVVAVGVGFYACLLVSYQMGWGTAKVYAGPQWASKWFFNQAVTWIKNATETDVPGLCWIGVGGAFTLTLMTMRARFLWWPFHPIGYVVAHTGFPYSFWTHYMVAWACKVWVLRYGGMGLYRRVLPFFIGMILGDVATQTFWSAFASVLGIPVYQFIS